MPETLSPRWQPGPLAPTLGPHRVDVWWVPLPGAEPSAGHRATAHRARRDILGRYLGRAPGSLVFGRQPEGKPFLEGEDLQFNLSHSHDAALVAVSGGLAVGVDIERRRRIDDPMRLARRILSQDETALLSSLHPADRPARFLELWTRMEARQKALGRGIFAPAVAPAEVSEFLFRPEADLFAALALSPPGADVELSFFRYVAR